MNEASPRNKSHKKKLDFIENKKIDYHSLEDILSVSKKNNHWANFGPVAGLVEAHIHEMLNLPDHRQVVMCKSGTSALHTLVNLYEIKSNKKLKWVISAFGFVASKIGPLHDAKVIDCDENGLLDIKILSQLPSDSWDAVLFTNTFAICQDLSPLVKLCQKLGKLIIIDNAVGLNSLWRNTNPVNEAISFHQTKPWGMGEGGCLIIDKKDEELTRSLICFGLNETIDHRQYYSNEKIAEINAAIILQRLKNWSQWSDLYIMQFQRIVLLGKEMGLNSMVDSASEVIHSNIPFLTPYHIKKTELSNQRFVIQKYYRPLEKGNEVATNIYSHIINIPCHSELVKLSDEAILEGMKQVLDRAQLLNNNNKV